MYDKKYERYYACKSLCYECTPSKTFDAHIAIFYEYDIYYYIEYRRAYKKIERSIWISQSLEDRAYDIVEEEEAQSVDIDI